MTFCVASNYEFISNANIVSRFVITQDKSWDVKEKVQIKFFCWMWTLLFSSFSVLISFIETAIERHLHYQRAASGHDHLTSEHMSQKVRVRVYGGR